MPKYYCYQNGKRVYTQADSLSQAAVKLGHKTNSFISSNQVAEEKAMLVSVFTIAYQTDPTGQVNVVEVVAYDFDDAVKAIMKTTSRCYYPYEIEPSREATETEAAKVGKVTYLYTLY